MWAPPYIGMRLQRHDSAVRLRLHYVCTACTTSRLRARCRLPRGLLVYDDQQEQGDDDHRREEERLEPRRRVVRQRLLVLGRGVVPEPPTNDSAEPASRKVQNDASFDRRSVQSAACAPFGRRRRRYFRMGFGPPAARMVVVPTLPRVPITSGTPDWSAVSGAPTSMGATGGGGFSSGSKKS